MLLNAAIQNSSTPFNNAVQRRSTAFKLLPGAFVRALEPPVLFCITVRLNSPTSRLIHIEHIDILASQARRNGRRNFNKASKLNASCCRFEVEGGGGGGGVESPRVPARGEAGWGVAVVNAFQVQGKIVTGVNSTTILLNPPATR